MPSLRVPLGLLPKALAILPRTGQRKPLPERGGGSRPAAPRLASSFSRGIGAAATRRRQTRSPGTPPERRTGRSFGGARSRTATVGRGTCMAGDRLIGLARCGGHAGGQCQDLTGIDRIGLLDPVQPGQCRAVACDSVPPAPRGSLRRRSGGGPARGSGRLSARTLRCCACAQLPRPFQSTGWYAVQPARPSRTRTLQPVRTSGAPQ